MALEMIPCHTIVNTSQCVEPVYFDNENKVFYSASSVECVDISEGLELIQDRCVDGKPFQLQSLDEAVRARYLLGGKDHSDEYQITRTLCAYIWPDNEDPRCIFGELELLAGSDPTHQMWWIERLMGDESFSMSDPYIKSFIKKGRSVVLPDGLLDKLSIIQTDGVSEYGQNIYARALMPTSAELNASVLSSKEFRIPVTAKMFEAGIDSKERFRFGQLEIDRPCDLEEEMCTLPYNDTFHELYGEYPVSFNFCVLGGLVYARGEDREKLYPSDMELNSIETTNGFVGKHFVRGVVSAPKEFNQK